MLRPADDVQPRYPRGRPDLQVFLLEAQRALSHAMVTLAILYAFDDGVTDGLRVGYAYWNR
jgi:hypothetical protein